MSEAERRRMDKDLARNRANNRLHAWAGLPAGFQYLLAPTAVVMSLCLLAGARSGKERVVLLVCAAASAASLGFLWYLMRGAHVF